MKSCIIIFICLLLASCDAGLAPPPPAQPGFGGTVYFTHGSWPSTDSLVNVWIFASKIYPLDSATVYNGLFASPPTIIIYPSMVSSLPFNVDTVSYFFPLSTGTYKYIGVIQQTSSELFTKGIRVFRVVGFYKDASNPLQPGNVTIQVDSQVQGVNINVDFKNPPPQPF
jgi:hypothetical protein